jgi:hypothetical protein
MARETLLDGGGLAPAVANALVATAPRDLLARGMRRAPVAA